VLGPDPQAAFGPLGGDSAGRRGGPHPPFGHPLAGGEGFSPREPRIAPETPPQVMSRREDPAREQGAGQGVPMRAPGGAGHGHDRAPPPAAAPPPLAGSGGGMSGLASHGAPGTGSAG
jgi:hypothetical protein